MCRCSKEREEESHLRSGQCEVYGDLRAKYQDLEDDQQLVDFFNDILERREDLESEEEEARARSKEGK
jgi:hypothetical protein